MCIQATLRMAATIALIGALTFACALAAARGSGLLGSVL
jgi:hypothetical protein